MRYVIVPSVLTALLLVGVGSAQAAAKHSAAPSPLYVQAPGGPLTIQPSWLHGAPASWSGCIAAGVVHCYLPSDIREAYGVDQLPEDGLGQTIVLVDSYGSPDATQELQAFHDTFFPNEPAP